MSDNVNDYAYVEQQHSMLIPLGLYGELIKGKQTFLLVYTSFLAYLISAWPNINLITSVWLFLSIFAAVSGSTLLNMYVDRDIDKMMERTKHRVLPSGRIKASSVLMHGLIFTFAGIAASGIFVNTVTMRLIFAGAFFDVVIYSMLLKRRTRFSILFGGIAGGLPAMAGRTAFTGEVDFITLLFGIFVISWIPLHILTLALMPKNKSGYENAGVPMWPVVSSEKQTIRVITLSALISSAAALTISWALDINLVMFIHVIILSFYITYLSIKNLFNPTEEVTWKIFKRASMFMGAAYLWWLFGVMF
ncbi:MAG: protoheme IX farnesyltransferase [Candidatus Kariarchaeaceae archaeon]